MFSFGTKVSSYLVHFWSAICIYIFLLILFITHFLHRLLSVAYYVFLVSLFILKGFQLERVRKWSESLYTASIFYNLLCLIRFKKWYFKKISLTSMQNHFTCFYTLKFFLMLLSLWFLFLLFLYTKNLVIKT